MTLIIHLNCPISTVLRTDAKIQAKNCSAVASSWFAGIKHPQIFNQLQSWIFTTWFQESVIKLTKLHHDLLFIYHYFSVNKKKQHLKKSSFFKLLQDMQWIPNYAQLGFSISAAQVWSRFQRSFQEYLKLVTAKLWYFHHVPQPGSSFCHYPAFLFS